MRDSNDYYVSVVKLDLTDAREISQMREIGNLLLVLSAQPAVA
jgi:hypothetical protein